MPKTLTDAIVEDNGYIEKKRDSVLSAAISDITSLSDEIKEKTNPFKIDEKSDLENLEYALQILEDITSRLNTSKFNKIYKLVKFKKHMLRFFLNYIKLITALLMKMGK